MKRGTSTSHSHDMLSNQLLAFALFCLPAIAIVATGHYRIGGGWRTAVWTAALSIMGAGCLAKAVPCGRGHCYITGAFLLVMAVVALVHGLWVLPLCGECRRPTRLTL